MTIQLAYQQLVAQLCEIYDGREADNIADRVIEHVTGQQKFDRIINKSFVVSKAQQEDLQIFSEQLLKHKPVQYVLGEAWFCNMKLYVNENVLIPRPETEELVGWVIDETTQKSKVKSQKLIDIGTGSGCIPIAIKKKLGNAEVYALDISAGALEIAKRNASQQNVQISFHQLDFLDNGNWQELPVLDIIISNPPYIKKSEERTMAKNVLQYEPHVALFVPDENALLFYKAIAEFAKTNLANEGSIYVEINEALGNDVVRLFGDAGFKKIIIKKDLQGKDRMIKASF